METKEGDVIWIRSPLFPLRRAFSCIVYGNLETKLIEAAKSGDSLGVLTWLDRGAYMGVAGPAALKAAASNHHTHTVGLLLHFGVSDSALPAGSPPGSELLKSYHSLNQG